LKAGERRDVTITIDNSALSFYDDRTQSWTSEAGDFDALVGNSSDNLPLQIKFKLQ
jgi:beta-glucosidase